MSFAIIATLQPSSSAARSELRLDHLRYMECHQHRIVAGGPVLHSGEPTQMILLTRFADRQAAEAFMRTEPYAASGRVFSRVQVLAWSQVLPELTAGALARAICEETDAVSLSSEGLD